MKIKNIREGAYLTQEQFGKEIGVSATTIRKWEKEKAKPSLKHQKLVLDFAKKNGITV